MSSGANEYVVDASVLVKALGYKDEVGLAARALVTEATCHAPHLVDAEVGHAFRRGVRVGEMADQTARVGLAALRLLVDNRYPHTGRFATLAWELRQTITFYDALYVAVATVLGLPLLTADPRLARAPGLTCEVELVG